MDATSSELEDPSVEPVRKRARTDSYTADADTTLLDEDAGGVPEKIIQDPQYYFIDGDCKIRVENTLFSIHRFLLARDSSVLETMFQLPQGTEKPQGLSDEDPIVLVGDTAEQFHALCWALYAMPDEITKQRTNKSSIDKLANVAAISHKYHLATYHTWAMSSIKKRCTNFDYLSSCSLDHLTSLVGLFILCADAALVKFAQKAWITRLECVAPSSAEFLHALDFAEKHDLRHFLGQVYYTHVTSSDVEGIQTVSSSIAVKFPYAPNMSPERLQCSLLGYWSLSSYWRRLALTQPELPRPVNCTIHMHTNHCVRGWKSAWQAAENVGGACDVVAKLKFIQKIYGVAGSGVHPTCVPRGDEVIQLLITGLEATLPDHFLGPPP
ncbi:hypothetical protein B0H11DRAFT_2034482 [Mycena galericulata]|nr:hypothetical protein B0H11DRAFT_2034482 [Mycena galericulata]